VIPPGRWENSVSVDALKRLAALALTAVLLTACGGGAAVDGAKVEDSLRDYLFAINPEESSFPSGAGAPRVRHKACTDQHVKVQKGQVLSGVAGMWGARFREEVALWSCVVTFGSLALPTTVAVTGSTEVVWAVALPFEELVMNIFLQDLNTVGAGPPRVKGNSCKKIGKPARLPGFVRPAHLAFWSCVVRFAHPPFHVRVALKDNGQIAWAMLVPRQSHDVHMGQPGLVSHSGNRYVMGLTMRSWPALRAQSPQELMNALFADAQRVANLVERGSVSPGLLDRA
jgi:hypothetical protein